MRRREFVAALGGAAIGFSWSLAARAQQPAMPVIGYLDLGSPISSAPFLEAFRGGLGEAGYVEGESVAINYRWAEERYDGLPHWRPISSAARSI